MNTELPLPSRLATAPHGIVGLDGVDLSAQISLERRHSGVFCSYIVTNHSPEPLAIREIVLADLEHGAPPETRFYGEAFNMISQTAGTLGTMVDIDPLTDRGHYRLPEPKGFRTVYGLMHLTPPGGDTVLLAFTSCRRFIGQFHVNARRVRIALDTQGLALQPGECWSLEELMAASGHDAAVLLGELADRISVHHPRLPCPRLPTGWCSWYCYGPEVTSAQVLENLAAIRTHLPNLRYIQVDDGYQRWMGDWMDASDRFPEGIQPILRHIRDAGFEPAIWVAPFIASPESALFRAHPQWFVTDTRGQPLRADTVTFGGWRQGPWYMLDGTHPEAQAHLERLFRIMREDWGCTYFKLDANAWGALPFGRRHDLTASSVEAYRRGMAAIRRGAGAAFLLGCNHALWPSLGEVHGSRSSMDIGGSWDMITRVARENLLRNWQNGHLWWNDPDCLKLDLPGSSEAEKSFHRAATYATGGMLLSGDAVVRYGAQDWDILAKAALNPGLAARFEDHALELGWIDQGTLRIAVLLNWCDEPQSRRIRLAGPTAISDFWSGEDLGRHRVEWVVRDMPARSGRVLILRTDKHTRRHK